MAKKHVVFLTEEEINAALNSCRVVLKMGGESSYFEQLASPDLKSAFDKLYEKWSEISSDADGK